MRYFVILACLSSFLASAQNDYDARILAYRGLRYPCVDSVTPVLRIQNAGAQAMNSCVVETWKNGVVDNSFDWQLAIAAVTNEERQPAFPTVAATAGDVLEFRIISVNGNPDQDATGNVFQFTVSGAASTCGQQTVEVEVFTDAQPGETTWLIRNDLGQVVAQGGPYATGSSIESHWVTLPSNACFGVELSDSGGDGMAGGHLKVRCDGMDLIDVDGSTFTEEAYKGLRSGTVLGLPEVSPNQQLQVYPNPAHDQATLRVDGWQGQAQVQVLDASGRVVRERSWNGALGPVTFDLRGLAPGLHAVVMRGTQGVSAARLLVE